MTHLLTQLDFWRIVSELAWPVAVLIIFLFLRLVIKSLLARENLNIEVAGIKVGVQEATRNTGDQLAELQATVAQLKAHLDMPNVAVMTESVYSNENIPLSIVWVDDNPENNAFIIDRLQNRGDTVMLARDTSEAISLMASRYVDALITDMGRTENGTYESRAGIQLIKQVRTMGKKVPILVFSTGRAGALEAEVKEAGGIGVTSSAVDVLGFLESVRRLPAN